jgi:hypothetical protein
MTRLPSNDKSVERTKVPDLNSTQLERNSIQLYNGHHAYHYDCRYVPNAEWAQLKMVGEGWVEGHFAEGGEWVKGVSDYIQSYLDCGKPKKPN